MANLIYPKFKEALLNQGANSNISSGAVKVMLVDTGTYTYSATHTFVSDITGIVATSPALTTKTVVNGLFDADDPVFTSVTGVTAEALIIFIDTGVAATSRLVAYFDTGVTGLPVTPNGGNINVAFSNSGIFQL